MVVAMGTGCYFTDHQGLPHKMSSEIEYGAKLEILSEEK